MRQDREGRKKQLYVQKYVIILTLKLFLNKTFINFKKLVRKSISSLYRLLKRPIPIPYLHPLLYNLSNSPFEGDK